MPKYKNKSAAKMKQHQVEHMTEGYAAFLDQLDADHEATIQRMRDDHKKHKEELIAAHEKQKDDLLAETMFDIKQNKTQQPKEIAPGIVVLPGDYYVDDPDNPFGISADDLANSYEKA